MTSEELYNLCKVLNWKELQSLMTSNLKSMSIRIFIAALIETHHPVKRTREQYTLTNCWKDKKLVDHPVSDMESLFSGNIWLYDFYEAYMIAGSYLKEAPVDIKKVEDTIRDFVQLKKLNLAKVLTKHKDIFAPDLLVDLEETFGNLEITEQDILDKDKNLQSFLEKREKRELEEKNNKGFVKTKIEHLMGFKADTCSLNDNETNYGYTLHFNEQIDEKVIRELKAMLKAEGLKVHSVNMESSFDRHLQLLDSLPKILSSLDKILEQRKAQETMLTALQDLSFLNNANKSKPGVSPELSEDDLEDDMPSTLYV